MTAIELLADLARRGIRLEADGERLRFHPRSALKPDELDQLKAYKAELLTKLQPTPVTEVDGALGVELFDANEFYWSQISAVDRDYLLGPRHYPTACAWCGGRLVHSHMCDELRRLWEPTVPFGKHAGKRVSEVPIDCLTWLVRQSGIDRKLRTTIRQRLRGDAARSGRSSYPARDRE